ncbi:NAD(P)-binding protein [Rhizoclosmatium globosum]|uniref:NAD(P)-binding protein n=1 Tax=Rhizoclosmatium globosum TaxID=329046 RepID=A0A1Y2B100_9FUNG|nr:NAD(P)-binding protein [Rhizoclosmatium globosum]|eukprot:ORY28414.1 NAD(P)-binding protein [Rhizoclosmatium globosum]
MWTWLFGSRLIPQEQYTGKVVVITGCDSGFGYGTALDLVALGFHVAAGCYTETGILDLTSTITTNPSKYSKGKLTALRLDVTSDESVAKFTSQVTAESANNIFAVINNAGISVGLPLEVISMHDHKQVMEVNYFGPLRIIRAFSPFLRRFSLAQKMNNKNKRVYPRFITISSISDRGAPPLLSAYATSKHAVKTLTEIARLELGQFGIQTTVIEPYYAVTPIVVGKSAGHRRKYEEADEEVKNAYFLPPLEEMERGEKAMMTDFMSLKAQDVVDVIVKAVRTAHVENYYLVGFMAHVIVGLYRVLPQWLIDRILLASYKDIGFHANKDKYL